MQKSFIVSVFLLCFALTACSNSESFASQEEKADVDEIHSGMVKIKASSKHVFLGTDNVSALLSERPKMRVEFDYDYSIGVHEVTQGEFSALMPGFKFDGSGSLPVVEVSYFDAVLFANARSKSEKLDTAYSYTEAHFDSKGNCTGLDAFVFDPTVEAYRLPTEAEWTFAANTWKAENEWHNGNSGFVRHEACEKNANGLGLCDMMGNVKEWSNDWLGYFKDTVVTNYVGSMDGGNLLERVVKGGYYGTDPENLNLFSRGNVYTVRSSDKYPYVGFRLAFGAIPEPTWMNSNGSAVSSRVVPLTSAATLKKLTRTNNMRLVFRNDVSGNLNFVDYRNGSLSVFEVQDTMEVYHPEVSPDGKYVAFCTMPEGVSGKSSLYVRELSASNSVAVKLDVASAAIPRWTVLESGDTAIVYVTDAGLNSDVSAWKSQSTWNVVFKNGSFEKPRKLFDGTFNGGVSQDKSLAISGGSLLRSKMTRDGSVKDSVWYNGEQACNASLSRDGEKRTLFLDFGRKAEDGKKLYGSHERILVVDSVGKLVQSVPSVKGNSFDHTEWVGAENLAVATLVNANRAHHEIVLVNMEDSSVVELFSGEELWHPNLWVKDMFLLDSSKSVLDADSAGQYYSENGSAAAAILRVKMEVLWQNKDSINTVVLGSSRPSTCVDPLYFSDDIKAINLSTVPNITYVSKFLLKNYLLNNVPHLKNIVISLDIDLWNRSENDPVNNFFDVEYKNYPGYVYDENHGFWKNESSKGMFEYTQNSILNEFEYAIHSYHNGVQRVIRTESCSWEMDNPGIDFDSTWLDYKQDDFQKNWDNVIEIIETAAKNGINVVGVVFPQSPGYKNTGAFGRYGLRRSEAVEIIKDLSALSKKYSNFKVLDENKMGEHDYSEVEAVNRDHLLNDAAPKMTSRIDSVLHSFGR